MPPAFNLSQDQTLQLVSLTAGPRTATRWSSKKVCPVHPPIRADRSTDRFAYWLGNRRLLEANPTVLGLLTILSSDRHAVGTTRRPDATQNVCKRPGCEDRPLWYSSRNRLVEPARVDTSSRRLPNCSLVKDPNLWNSHSKNSPGNQLPGAASQAAPRPRLTAWGRASYRRLSFCQGRSLPLWTNLLGELNRMAEPAIGGARISGILCHTLTGKSSGCGRC